MRKKILLFILCLSTFYGSYGQTVGSNVGLPTLSSALNAGVLTNNNGVINQDFTLDGNFIINSFVVTFDNVEITCDFNNLTFQDSRVQMNNGCVIDGPQDLNVDGTILTLRNSTIKDGFKVFVTKGSSYSFLELFESSELSNFFFVEVFDQCFFVMDNSTIDNAPTRGTSGNVSFIIKHSDILNSPSTWAFIVGGTGSYAGEDNTFSNNQHAIEVIGNTNFFRFIEKDSDFLSHSATTIKVRSAAIVELEGLLIDGTSQSGITIANSSSVTVSDSDFLNITDESVRLTNNGFSELIDLRIPNHVRNPSGLISPKAVILANNESNLTLTDINISNLDPDMNNGIYVIGSSAEVSGCEVDGGVCGINVESSICDLEGNDFMNTTGAGMFLNVLPSFTMCDNTAETSPIGIRFKGSSAGDIIDNHMNGNARGLVYDEDAFVNAQEEHGNDYSGNGFGAELLNLVPFVIDFSKYTVRNIPSENPSHTPDEWFDENGTVSGSCTTGGGGGPIYVPTCDPHPCPPPPPVCTLYVDNLHEFEGGYKMIHRQNILDYIENDPSLLTYTQIDQFCDIYCDSSLDELPTIREILEINKEDPVSFPVAPSDPFDIESTMTYYSQGEALSQNRNQERQSKFANLYNSTAQINPADSYETDYKEACLLVLDSYRGLPLAPSDEAFVETLASSCILDRGPAVYLARMVCSTNRINFTDPECTDLSPRSRQSSDNNDFAISPSPVMNYLNVEFEGSSSDVHKYSIINFNGTLINSGTLRDSKIDVSAIASGIYILRINDDHVKKFIKI